MLKYSSLQGTKQSYAMMIIHPNTKITSCFCNDDLQ